MNTLPASVQEQLREYDEYASTHFVAKSTLICVYEMTPTGEEVEGYIQVKRSAPTMSFLEFVEKVFMPETPFMEKLIIPCKGCLRWKRSWVWMAKQAYRRTCIGENEVSSYDDNPREDGTVDVKIHVTEPTSKQKTQHEEVADEDFDW